MNSWSRNLCCLNCVHKWLDKYQGENGKVFDWMSVVWFRPRNRFRRWSPPSTTPPYSTQTPWGNQREWKWVSFLTVVGILILLLENMRTVRIVHHKIACQSNCQNCHCQKSYRTTMKRCSWSLPTNFCRVQSLLIKGVCLFFERLVGRLRPQQLWRGHSRRRCSWAMGTFGWRRGTSLDSTGTGTGWYFGHPT